MARYVAYYRVLSRRALDRDAAVSLQRTAVDRFLRAGDELVGEFAEDETQHHRRHFEEALTSASRHHATLVIPRFRRFHRTVAFVNRLRDADVDFVALDMPGVNRTTIDSLAAAAAQHRKLLSERIKTSLQAARGRGSELGNPEIARAQPKAVQAASDLAQEKRQALRVEVADLRASGRSLRGIADDLNRRGIPTARGRAWHASSVRKILAEAGDPDA